MCFFLQQSMAKKCGYNHVLFLQQGMTITMCFFLQQSITEYNRV